MAETVFTNDMETTCRSCQTEAKWNAGEETTESERAHWSMWGCTCTTESAEEAQAWMQKVTR